MCVHNIKRDIHTNDSINFDTNTHNCEYIDPNNERLPDVTDNDLSILHYNVRGLIGKQHDLSRLLHGLGYKGGIPIVTLNETWLRSNTIDLVKIPGYKFMGKCREGRKGGGVGFLIRTDLVVRERQDLHVTSRNFEHMTIELKTDKDTILLVSLYRPLNTSDKDFVIEYTKLLQLLTNDNQNVIVCTDHNLDLLKINEHHTTWEFVESNLEKNLYPQITKPTRITHSTATLIDNIITSSKLNVTQTSYVILEDLSDHLPCLITIENALHSLRKPIEMTKRNLSLDNIKKISDTLQEENWSVSLCDPDVNVAFDYFHTKLISTIDMIAPERTTKVKPGRLNEPWLTASLLKCTKKQKSLYSLHIKDKTNVEKLDKYRNYRNTLKKVLRANKRNYYITRCNEYRHNTRKLWALTNEIIKKERNKSNIIEALNVNGEVIRGPQKIANEFCNFFSNVGKNYANKVAQSTKELKAYLQAITRSKKSMFLEPVTTQEIDIIIRELKGKMSSGYDNISNKLLKELRPCLLVPLTIIFNKSLTTGIFPDNMKLSDVTPLHKSKDKCLTNNYRPISLLITISKLLEKIMYTRTYGFLENTNQIYNSQYGFRPKHSCTNAISELTAEIVKGWEHNKNTIAAFLDLSKAFDTLKHKVLLDKMELYGIRGVCKKWFESYLKSRQMRTKCVTSGSMKTVYSEYYPVDYGTPQGSCLGPLLFLIFTNDLHLHIEHCRCILFADDTTIYVTHRNQRYARWCLESDLKTVVDWFKANTLTLNLDKSAILNFNPKPLNLNLEIDNTKLPDVTHIKFLGVWLDNTLSWNTHVNKLCYKIRQNLNLLRMGKNMLDIPTKKILYYAQIHSHLNYRILVWGNMLNANQLNRLQSIQNLSMKTITNGSSTSTDFKSQKILTIKCLIQLENLKHGYKLQNNLLPTPVAEACKCDSTHQSIMKQHHYNTRNKHLPNLPKAQKRKYRNSFLYQSILNYQELPTIIKKESTSYLSFVSRSKKFLLDTV